MLEKIINFLKPRRKIIVILGQTATGKTALSVELAKKYNGEIISADSRQIYRGLDLGSGKITQPEMQGIPHHMLDLADINHVFTVFEYKEQAQQALEKIISNKRVPIICGGTGMYIDALIYNQKFPSTPADITLRRELEKLSTQELVDRLKVASTAWAADIDTRNRPRIIRAIEIIESGSPRPVLSKISPYKVLFIGLNMNSQEELHERIYKRIISRIEEGMINEVQKLLDSQNLSYERAQSLGLEYKYISQYIKGVISYEEMIEVLFSEIKKYAKRQMTWFKRNKSIHWFHPSEYELIDTLVKKFLQ